MSDDIDPIFPDDVPEDKPGPNPETGIGGNNPPEPIYDQTDYLELKAKVDVFLAASNKWAKQKITSEALSGAITDQIAGLRKLFARVEAKRVDIKAPVLAAGKVIDGDFNALKDLLTESANTLKPALQKYLEAEQKKLDVKKAEEEAAAAALVTQANMAAMEAEKSGKIEDKVEAENLQKEATKTVKKAARPVKAQARSASGAGRTMSNRKRKVCTITNHRVLFMHYNDNPQIQELLLRLANGEANAAGFDMEGGIPGVTIKEVSTIT